MKYFIFDIKSDSEVGYSTHWFTKEQREQLLFRLFSKNPVSRWDAAKEILQPNLISFDSFLDRHGHHESDSLEKAQQTAITLSQNSIKYSKYDHVVFIIAVDNSHELVLSAWFVKENTFEVLDIAFFVRKDGIQKHEESNSAHGNEFKLAVEVIAKGNHDSQGPFSAKRTEEKSPTSEEEVVEKEEIIQKTLG